MPALRLLNTPPPREHAREPQRDRRGETTRRGAVELQRRAARHERLRCRPADTNANPARPLLARWCRIGSLPSHPALSQLSPPLSPASTNSLTSRVYMCVCVCVCVCEASGRGRHSLRRSRPPLVAAAAVPPGAVAHSLDVESHRRRVYSHVTSAAGARHTRAAALAARARARVRVRGGPSPADIVAAAPRELVGASFVSGARAREAARAA